MSHTNFVHLRVHTAYSLSEGAIHVKDLVKQCVGFKMPAVAMTDNNNMFAALEFSGAAASNGVQPIIGVTLFVKSPYRVKKKSTGKQAEYPEALVLLAQTDEGYRNLMKIVSKAHLESDVQVGVQFPIEEFEGRAEGVICLSGGVHGPIGKLLQDNNAKGAEDCLLDLKRAFGDRLYMEIQRHDQELEQRTEEAFLDLAYKHDVPIVATNQPYFVGPDMFEPHDALMCMADSTYVAVTERRKFNPEYRFKTAEEMIERFKDLPEAIENTENIAKRCSVKVNEIDPLLPNFTSGMDV
ncbi:MAG: PHP domain-containing protein [Kordiimonas sp.]